MSEKLVIICTYDPENPEKTNIPFVKATAALAYRSRCNNGVSKQCCFIGEKDIALHVPEAGFSP